MRLTRSQILACKPCKASIVDRLWEGSPRAVDDETLEWPDEWTEEETLRLMRRDARAVFWLSAQGLIPVTFAECRKAYEQVTREASRARDTVPPPPG